MSLELWLEQQSSEGTCGRRGQQPDTSFRKFPPFTFTVCAHVWRACNQVPERPPRLGNYSLQQHPSSTRASTHFPVFSISPYIHPSFSSGMSRMMTSPSSKLSSVLLLPAVWGKMVRTRGFFTMLLRPVATDTDLGRLFSSTVWWSGREEGRKLRI